jgi:hypothetical protein
MTAESSISSETTSRPTTEEPEHLRPAGDKPFREEPSSPYATYNA